MKTLYVSGLRYGKRYAACMTGWHTASFWNKEGKCIYCGKKEGEEMTHKFTAAVTDWSNGAVYTHHFEAYTVEGLVTKILAWNETWEKK